MDNGRNESVERYPEVHLERCPEVHQQHEVLFRLAQIFPFLLKNQQKFGENCNFDKFCNKISINKEYITTSIEPC